MRAGVEPATRGVKFQVQTLLLLALLVGSGCTSREVLYHPGGAQRCAGRRWWITRAEEGFWTYRYPDGALREQGRYVRGRRVGVWEQWYPSAQRRSRGRREWNENASRSDREGPWIFWHESGERQAVGVFRAGKREGHWDYSHSDGSLDAISSGEYHDDVRIQ